MRNPIDNEVFNFKFIVPLAYMEKTNIKEITEELHYEGVFVFTTFTNPSNPFFIEVQKQMYREDPSFKITLIILGIRYNKEYIA